MYVAVTFGFVSMSTYRLHSEGLWREEVRLLRHHGHHGRVTAQQLVLHHRGRGTLLLLLHQ